MTNYIPQVDYTSRDYSSIKSDLLALIPNFAPNWTSRDSSDFGIVLLELFSYLGDLINYQVDRAANESFLSTATQRDTVIKLASLLGYSPNEISPALGTVTFTSGNTAGTVIPAGTTVYSSGASPVSYTTDSSVTLSSTIGGTVSTTVTQGVIVTNESVGQSDGTANQSFPLAHTGVMPGSASSSLVTLTVDDVLYSRVSSTTIIDYSSTDLVYFVNTDGNGTTYVIFGDGVSGIIPKNGGSIKVTYRYSDVPGSVGNIPASSITSFDTTTLTGVSATVTNTLAFSGGADLETTDSIRINAPLALRTLNRAVSLMDYESLALTQSGIAKANAIASSFASVSLFLAGSSGASVSAAQCASIKTYLSSKIPPGTTLTVSSFTQAYPYVTLTVNVDPQYNAAAIQAQVTDALKKLFDYSTTSFGQVIPEGTIFSTCLSIYGVNSVTISDMEKLPASPAASGIYTQSTVTSTVATTSTGANTAVTVTDSSGVWTGAKVVTPSSLAGATIYSVNDGTTIQIAPTTTAVTIPAGTTITVTGNLGTTAGLRDLAFAYNEVPIYEPTYITVTTTGGS